MTKISVVIPIYNGSNYIKESLHSVMESSAAEIIVVDDGSEDSEKIRKIIDSMSKNVNYIGLPTNKGVAKALNVGIKSAKHNLISWISHDDVLVEGAFRFAFLKKFKRNNFTFANFILINEIDNTLQEIRIERILDRWDNKKNLDLIAFLSGLINGCTVIIPKKKLNKIGGFNEILRTTQDYDMWYRVLKKYKLKHEPVFKIKYRVHAEQGSMKEEFVTEGDEFWLTVLRDLDSGNFPCRKVSKLILMCVVYLFLNGSPYTRAKVEAETLILTQMQAKIKNFESEEILIGLKEGKNVFGKSDNNAEVTNFSFGVKDVIYFLRYSYKYNEFTRIMPIEVVSIIASKYRRKSLSKIIIWNLFRKEKVIKVLVRYSIVKMFPRLEYYKVMNEAYKINNNLDSENRTMQEYLKSSLLLILLKNSELQLNFNVKDDFLRGIEYLGYVRSKGYRQC